MSGFMEEEKEEEDRKKTWYRRECAYGSFHRRFALPADLEEDKAKCTFKNGKLTITIPKKKAGEGKPAGKKIAIETE